MNSNHAHAASRRAINIGLITVLMAILCMLQYRLWTGIGGLDALDTLTARIETQREQNAALRQRNADVAADVTDFKSGDAAIEERARTEFGMIKPGEVFYRIIDPDHVLDAAPSADALQ